MIRFMMAKDLRPLVEYSTWYSAIAQRFLSTDTILRDPRQVELLGDIASQVPLVIGVPRPAHMPDRRRRERRLCLGTRAAQRQQLI